MFESNRSVPLLEFSDIRSLLWFRSLVSLELLQASHIPVHHTERQGVGKSLWTTFSMGRFILTSLA
jgi:hypothetical protein